MDTSPVTGGYCTEWTASLKTFSIVDFVVYGVRTRTEHYLTLHIRRWKLSHIVRNNPVEQHLLYRGICCLCAHKDWMEKEMHLYDVEDQIILQAGQLI